MHISTKTNCRAKRPHRSPWRGAILFALGVIVLSWVELGLVERVPNSTAANYFALATDLKPVLRKEMNEVAARRSNAPDRRGLIPAASPAVRAH